MLAASRVVEGCPVVVCRVAEKSAVVQAARQVPSLVCQTGSQAMTAIADWSCCLHRTVSRSPSEPPVALNHGPQVVATYGLPPLDDLLEAGFAFWRLHRSIMSRCRPSSEFVGRELGK